MHAHRSSTKLPWEYIMGPHGTMRVTPGKRGGAGGEDAQVVVSRALLSKTIELDFPSNLSTPKRGARMLSITLSMLFWGGCRGIRYYLLVSTTCSWINTFSGGPLRNHAESK